MYHNDMQTIRYNLILSENNSLLGLCNYIAEKSER